MTSREQDFDRKLYELLERKPPGISASKIKDLTRIAMTSPKQYKNIVHSVQKFIQRCSADYKLGALYVLDSISQAAQRQKTLVAEKDSDGSVWSGAEYLERFEKILEEMFLHIMQCPEHDKEKVKRVLDIWLTKDVIYDKDLIRKIKDTYFSQRTVTNPLENNVHESQSITTSHGGDPRMVSVPNQPSMTMSTPLDSSALLATLNNLTQGTLNIPPFLSSNPITAATTQPINPPIAFNNVATNAHAVTPQFPNIPQPTVPTSNGFLQSPASSSNYPSQTVANNTETTKTKESLNDPLDFDYGDMDEDEDGDITQSGANGEINNTVKEAILTSSINVKPINVNQSAASAASSMPQQLNQDQNQNMANQYFQPSQGNQTNSSQSVTQQQQPPSTSAAPSLLIPGQQQQIPTTNNAMAPYPFPQQPWAGPTQQQPPPPPPGSIPPPQNQYQQPPPFPTQPWNGQQGLLPPQPWNPIPPQQHAPPEHYPNNPAPQGYPVPPPGHPLPPPGHPLPPPGHSMPPGPPPPGHPLHQGPPPAGIPVQHQGPPHMLQHQGPPGPLHQGPPGPNPQGPPGHLDLPVAMPQDDCIAYADPNVGRDFIKVLSRTLYVGSVTEDLTKGVMEKIFLSYGRVSTITINYDKNHAFIKMDTRAGAARALHGLKMQVSQKGKQNCKITVVRWGVGFGPKNCFDFDSGESLIPLTRLTETDRKWLFTSEKGGTGGRDIVGGIVVEEPDIVIGEGFSSGSGNKKLGPQHESSRKERRRGHDKGDRSSNSSDSRKYSDASWEGSSPRRHASKWGDAPNDSPFQGTASPPSQEHLTAQQRSRSFSPGLSPRTPDHLPQSEFGNPTLPTQEQLFQQRREQTPQHTHKREYFASHGDTPAREGKKTRWDK